jgi:hypothetical protein
LRDGVPGDAGFSGELALAQSSRSTSGPHEFHGLNAKLIADLCLLGIKKIASCNKRVKQWEV